MNKGIPVPKFLAFFLMLALAIPAPAQALRTPNGPEASGLEEGLSTALLTEKPRKIPTLSQIVNEAVYQLTRRRTEPITIEDIYRVLYEIGKKRDPTFTSPHMERTGIYVLKLAPILRATGMPIDTEQLNLWRAAVALRDLGKLFIPREILFKPGQLTNEEYEILKTHPRLGAELIDQLGERLTLQESVRQDLQVIRDAILHHHERPDGQGYPDGLRGEEISLIASITAVVDAFDAMTDADRPYMKLLKTRAEALEELKKYAGTQFSLLVVDAMRILLEQEGLWRSRQPRTPAGEGDLMAQLKEASTLVGDDPDKVRGIIREVIDRNPTNPAVLTTLANLMVRMGDYQDALAHIEKALKIKPWDVAARAVYAKVLFKLGWQSEAEEAIRQAVDEAPDNLPPYLVGIHIIHGRTPGHPRWDRRYADAREFAAPILNLQPKTPEGQFQLAGILHDLRSPAEGLAWVKQALLQRPNWLEAWRLFEELEKDAAEMTSGEKTVGEQTYRFPPERTTPNVSTPPAVLSLEENDRLAEAARMGRAIPIYVTRGSP